jgi:hypothetical protein
MMKESPTLLQLHIRPHIFPNVLVGYNGEDISYPVATRLTLGIGRIFPKVTMVKESPTLLQQVAFVDFVVFSQVTMMKESPTLLKPFRTLDFRICGQWLQ